MGKSISEIPRAVRRRLKRVVQKSKDRHHARRAHAILLLHEGYGMSEVARLLRAAHSALQDWKKQFEQLGEAGLVPESPGVKAGEGDR